MSLDKVRIVFLGDSGCGKSSLVSLIANNEVLTNSWTTVGCQIEVKVHDYKEDTSHQKQFFIELFDIGSSMSHRIARNIFYQQINGIVLVHDLTNKKSHENLRSWLVEMINKDGKDVIKGNMTTEDLDSEQLLGLCQLPIIVVGTKNDLIDEKQRKTCKSRTLATELGAEEIYVNSHDVRSFQAGSTNAVKIQKFFDKVIERKYLNRDNSTFYEKQRKIVGLQSPLLSDSNRYFSPFTSPTIGNYSNFTASLEPSTSLIANPSE